MQIGNQSKMATLVYVVSFTIKQRRGTFFLPRAISIYLVANTATIKITNKNLLKNEPATFGQIFN